jgi:nuclear transport factor 2 (NTF2) superfamily protein
VQPLRKDEKARNPQTVDEARAFVKYVESLFTPWNIDALVDGFTEDCVVRFGTVPEFRGREALRMFFAARSAKQKGYRLKKEFRTLMNYDDQRMGRRLGGCGKRPTHARTWRRDLGHARWQDRGLGSGLQCRPRGPAEQRCRPVDSTQLTRSHHLGHDLAVLQTTLKGHNRTHAPRQIGRGYARSMRISISLRSVPKSIGLVSNASAPRSTAWRFVSASP